MLSCFFFKAVPKAFLISLTGGGGDKIESSHMPLFDAAFLFIQLNFNVTCLLNPFFLSPLSPSLNFPLVLSQPTSSLSRLPLLSGFLLSPLQQVAVPASSGVGGMVRPVTGADVGIRRAEIRPGLREIILCKDQDGKVGLRLRAIDNVSQRRKLFDRHLFLR